MAVSCVQGWNAQKMETFNTTCNWNALWARITMNTDWSTGPLARPFAPSLAPLTRLLARSLHSLPGLWDSD